VVLTLIYSSDSTLLLNNSPKKEEGSLGSTLCKLFAHRMLEVADKDGADGEAGLLFVKLGYFSRTT